MSDETKDFIVRLPPDLWRKTKINSVDTGESMNGLIARLLAEYFAGAKERKRNIEP